VSSQPALTSKHILAPLSRTASPYCSPCAEIRTFWPPWSRLERPWAGGRERGSGGGEGGRDRAQGGTAQAAAMDLGLIWLFSGTFRIAHFLPLSLPFFRIL